jgi:hypothetical protein
MNLVDTPVSFLQVLISRGLKSFILEVLILLELRQHTFPSVDFKRVPKSRSHRRPSSQEEGR